MTTPNFIKQEQTVGRSKLPIIIWMNRGLIWIVGGYALGTLSPVALGITLGAIITERLMMINFGQKCFKAISAWVQREGIAPEAWKPTKERENYFAKLLAGLDYWTQVPAIIAIGGLIGLAWNAVEIFSNLGNQSGGALLHLILMGVYLAGMLIGILISFMVILPLKRRKAEEHIPICFGVNVFENMHENRSKASAIMDQIDTQYRFRRNQKDPYWEDDRQ